MAVAMFVGAPAVFLGSLLLSSRASWSSPLMMSAPKATRWCSLRPTVAAPTINMISAYAAAIG